MIAVVLAGTGEAENHKEPKMQKLTIAMALSLALAGGAYAQSGTTTSPSGTQMSQADCTANWSRLNTSNAADLTETQLQGSIRDFSAADTDKNGKLSQTEFMSACQRGLVSSSGSRALTPGQGTTTSPSGTTTSPGGTTTSPSGQTTK